MCELCSSGLVVQQLSLKQPVVWFWNKISSGQRKPESLILWIQRRHRTRYSTWVYWVNLKTIFTHLKKKIKTRIFEADARWYILEIILTHLGTAYMRLYEIDCFNWVSLGWQLYWLRVSPQIRRPSLRMIFRASWPVGSSAWYITMFLTQHKYKHTS